MREVKIKSQSGFTLIELLIVIAIIGILASLFVPNLMSIREKARDTQRKSDLRLLQKALELYKQDQALPAYPVSLPNVGTVWSNVVTGTIYTNKVPGDPLFPTPTPYFYTYDNSELKYRLCACLENIADTDGINCIVCGGYSCSTNKCFTVIEP